jgi:hypothetical protein
MKKPQPLPYLKGARYSISVSGKTYDRLSDKVPYGTVAKFVDGILMTALDDPTIMARLLEQLRQQKALS